MIKDQIAAIQSRLENAPNIPASTREELLSLLAGLEEEVTQLAQTHAEHAGKIAELTDRTTGVVTQPEKEPELVEAALQDLRESVVGFETSHPQMTGIVGRLATTLSNMGI